MNIWVMMLGMCFGSCQKVEVEPECKAHETDGMSLEIFSIENSSQIIDSSFVKTIYNAERGIVSRSVEFQPWHMGPSAQSVGEDSLCIYSSIQFEVYCDTDFLFTTFELGFYYVDSKEKFESISGEEVRYKNLEDFYRILDQNEWDNNEFEEKLTALASISIPDSYDDWINGPYSSNGFYFDHENFSFSKLNYDEATKSIEMEGDFDVSLKILSCGFYDFYSISNASFATKLSYVED